jgi:23S rRNA-/tRNA-specific pseudouridylate synthase
MHLANAHRLDFETTGVLLGQGKSVLVKLADQFASEKPVKSYIALVHGHAAQEHFEVDLKLALTP